MMFPRQDYKICALDWDPEHPSHTFELIFPAGFQVTSVFTPQVLNHFKLVPMAVDDPHGCTMCFKKKVAPAHDSENTVFEVSLATGYHARYPRWNRWVVWRAALEDALNDLIELMVSAFYSYDNNTAIVVPPNDAEFNLSQLCEEVEIRYPMPYDGLITVRGGNTIVMDFMREFNALEWLERRRIHSFLAGMGATNIEDLNDPMLGCNCQYDCPGSEMPIQITVEPAQLNTSKWCFQHAHASILCEPILKLTNGYSQWLREDPFFQPMFRRRM